jgi:ABC-type Mn2+/Zn2+ transport system ATPase subunit
VELLDVGKRYRGEDWVVRDVNLSIAPGELVVLRGSNGSGKSSLLRMIAGVARLSSGSITGRSPVVAYAPDAFPPVERMSAVSFLRHVGRMRGLGSRAALTRASDLVDRMGVVGDPHASLRTLSKGNRQKICLAQAFIGPTGLLALDEPTSGLDEEAVAMLLELVRDQLAAGAMCVVADHEEQQIDQRATTYVIADARLRPHDPSPARVVRVATLLAGAEARPVEWRTLDGVDAVVTLRDGGVDVRVSAEHSDRLLGTALASGWTVIALHPDPSTHDEAGGKA